MSQAELDSAPQGPALAPPMSTLVATDGSDHALKAARFVVGILPAGAEIRLLVVLSMELQSRTYLGELSDAEARRARIEEATEEAVEETRRILEAAGHTVSVHRRFGNPPDETLAEVLEWQPDLVVVGRRGLGRASSFLLGSVSSFLLRHSPAPVLVVP
jgi:nucleotide-binding universal stress UspA family protein